MKNITQNMRCIALLALATLVATGCNAETKPEAAAKKSDGLFANPVVAKGKGFEIKQNEIEESFIEYKSNLASRGQSLREDQRSTIESNLLQRLIVTRILMSNSTDDDKAKAKETTDKLMAEAKKQFPSEELFQQQLKAMGMSIEQFRSRAYEQALSEVVIERDLKSKITITEEQAKKYYDENPERFERPETVRAAHILISTVKPGTQEPLPADKKKEKEKLAKDLKARADKGEDFAKLAGEYSDDPGSKDKGGEYTFGRGEMVPEFETAAFSMKTNQVSDLVETRFGYHIIKTLQKIAPEKVDFAKVLPDLKEGLAQQEAQKALPEYFEKIKKEANVEIVGADKKETPAASTTEKPATK